MRILTVIHYPVFGGPHNYVLRSASRLAQRGCDSTVVLPTETGNAVERLQEGAVDLVQLPLHRLRASADPRLHLGMAAAFLPNIRALRRVIRARAVDLVVVSGLANPHAGLAARLERRPIVWDIPDTRLPPAARWSAMQVALGLSDSLLFAGRCVADLHGGPSRFRQPWFVYYPPVDTSIFRANHGQRLQTRRALGIPPNAPVIGTVANVNPQKGLEYLMRAAGRIFTEVDDLRMMVVGATYAHHGALQTLLESELKNSGVPRERVHFTGAVSNPERYYPAMDVKLITSPPRSEGVPTTALEALACGVPVVATDVGAIREAIENGRTGFIVPPLNTDAIAESTVALLKSPERRRAMSVLAVQQARLRFGVEKYVDTVEQAFMSACEHYTTGLLHRRTST